MENFMSIGNFITMNIDALGFNIKIERLKKKLSQEQFAEIVNLSTTSISAIEKGKQIPSAINLYLMAKALNVDINEFFKGIE